jgi:hypothetical protein
MAAHGLRVLGEMHVHLDDQLKRLESDIFAMNYAPGLDMGILEYADNTQLFQCLTAAHTAVTDARDRVRKLEYDLGERWLRLGQPATAEQWQAIAYTRRLALMETPIDDRCDCRYHNRHDFGGRMQGDCSEPIRFKVIRDRAWGDWNTTYKWICAHCLDYSRDEVIVDLRASEPMPARRPMVDHV